MSSNSRLSILERVRLITTSSIGSLLDPTRQDLVASLGELTGTTTLQKLHRIMLSDREGRRLLYEKPTITSRYMKELHNYSDNTFGKKYYEFMKTNNISADTRTPVKYIEDQELSYVMQRYRQCHDFYHVITGLIKTTVLNELVLKVYESVIFGFPMNYMALLAAKFKLNQKEFDYLLGPGINWALMSELTAKKHIINIKFEDCFLRDLKELRNELGIIEAPVYYDHS